MKVLILSTFEQSGGAAIAAKRLMEALRKSGVDVKMLVRDKQTDSHDVISVNTSFWSRYHNRLRFLWERFVIFICNKLRRENLFAVSIANTGSDLIKYSELRDADLIHIHWINQGFLSINDIDKIVKLGKPIIWTMHDQWTYTGICHYTGGCEKFTEICAICPQLSNTQKLSKEIQTKKKRLYNSKMFTFVGCSQWISKEGHKSSLFEGVDIVSIPNPINTGLYRVTEKKLAIEATGLPRNKKLVLFGACKVTDERKGFEYLKRACDILYEEKKYEKEDIIIVVFGGKSEEIATLLPYSVQNIGYVNDVQTMIYLYNAVDLFIIPSLEDNLPNTVMEAMACGTPCVGFNVGGIPEMIDHKENGYVAAYKNAKDLANGINWILDEADYDSLSSNAREKVIRSFSEEVIAKKYIGLYKSLLD